MALSVESSHLLWPSKADMIDYQQPCKPHTFSSSPISISTQLSELILPLLQTILSLGKPTSDSFCLENSTSSIFLLLTSSQMQPSWKMIPDHPTKSCFSPLTLDYITLLTTFTEYMQYVKPFICYFPKLEHQATDALRMSFTISINSTHMSCLPCCTFLHVFNPFSPSKNFVIISISCHHFSINSSIAYIL